MQVALWAAILAALFPASARAAGLARSDNFSVIAPATTNPEAADYYAKLIVDRAESFRSQFTKEWLGDDLPAGEVRTMIRVSFSDTENSARTLARDNPSQKFHNVLLTTTAENASGSMLQHEIVHTVLATAYPQRLPPWVEEGIASRFDRAELVAVRQREVRSWAQTGRFPNVAGVFAAASIASFDDTGYAAAESLVAYFLTLGDKPTLLRFAEAGQRSGWEEALRAHYNIKGLSQLQRDWQAYMVKGLP